MARLCHSFTTNIRTTSRYLKSLNFDYKTYVTFCFMTMDVLVSYALLAVISSLKYKGVKLV